MIIARLPKRLHSAWLERLSFVELHLVIGVPIIDLVKTYHQILVQPKDVTKTTIITSFGMFGPMLSRLGELRSVQQASKISSPTILATF